MANENNENENKTSKVGMSIYVDSALRDAIVQIAEEEERSVTNTAERLLKANPKVRSRMASATA